MKTYRPIEEETTDDRLNRLEEELQECRAKVNRSLTEFRERLDTIQRQLTTLIEIAEAWNNWRGFARVMSVVSTTIKTLAPIALLITALVVFFKTGTWTWGSDK
jgi:uncharacterized coiled-coil protein SlyX